MANLEQAIEHQDELPAGIEAHHETAISNGHTIFLHGELEGGIQGRLYDLLHLGVGHYWQWNSNASSELEFLVMLPWQVGQRNFLGVGEEELGTVRSYEFEASRVALSVFAEILEGSDISKETQAELLRFYTDYVCTDLEYIIDYYRTGEVRDFYKNWQLDAETLPTIDTNFAIEPKEREASCIPVLKGLPSTRVNPQNPANKMIGCPINQIQKGR